VESNATSGSLSCTGRGFVHSCSREPAPVLGLLGGAGHADIVDVVARVKVQVHGYGAAQSVPDTGTKVNKTTHSIRIQHPDT
jgi:hypothetical protein